MAATALETEPDLFSRDWRARRTIDQARPWFEPKFPYAVLLNTEGQPVEPEQRVHVSNYDESQHKGRIGCPCCAAPLRFTPARKVLGSKDRKAYYSSLNLDDHKECPLASPEPHVRKTTYKKLAFFGAPGPKVLYWNLPFQKPGPKYDPRHYSPLQESDSGFHTGRLEDDAPETYKVSTMKEFLALSKHKDLSDPFWQDVFVYIDQHRIPWNQFVAGFDQGKLLRMSFNRAARGVEMPQVAIATFAPESYEFHDFPGVYRFKSLPLRMPDTKDALGIRHFNVQILAEISSENHPAFNALAKGGSFALHGITSVNMLEIQGIVNGQRHGNIDPKQNTLRVIMRVNSLDDIVDVDDYLSERGFDPTADVDFDALAEQPAYAQAAE